MPTIQDVFLNEARENKVDVTIFLVNGVPIKGKVIGFDNFTVVVSTEKGQNLIYKHAISTMLPTRPLKLELRPKKKPQPEKVEEGVEVSEEETVSQ
ncbi:MAG: RNA chaperone Hfq [bacterium]